MTLEQHRRHVPGRRRGDVLLYALSTCGWCRKTKNLLDELGVEYDYIYVDLLDSYAKKEALEVVRACNPEGTFPTMVINGHECIAGYQPEKTREALTGGRY